MIGKILSPVLVEIENQLWNFESENGGKPEYTIDGFRAVVKIFTSTIFDKMWEFQDNEKLDEKEKRKILFQFSSDLNNMIIKYTNIEIEKLYEKN